MRIDRETHIKAPPRQVKAYCTDGCPCPSALTLVPEGAGTRIRLQADVSPDDLALHVEAQLVEVLRQVRAHFDPTP